MDMMVFPMATAPLATTGAASGSAKTSGGGAGFMQTLVHHIAGQGGSGDQAQSQAAQTTVSAAPIFGAAGGETSETGSPLEQLLALIDQLLDKLDLNNEEAPSDEELAAQLGAMLKQLEALLSLLGAPVVPQYNQQHKAAETQSGADGNVDVKTASLKLAVQDALLGLQALLQQGSMKQVAGQEPAALIERQLHALYAAMETTETGEQPQPQKREAGAAQQWFVQQAKAGDQTILLQRLTGSTVHPSYYAETSGAEETASLPELPTNVSEPTTIAQLSLHRQDQVRDFAPQLAKTAASSAFVLADQFAESMTEMVVQKFDIRSLNGLTEARLQLFPQHLGTVDVKITMQNGLLTAIFHTDTVMAKDMLENQLAQLRVSLQNQGLTVDRLEVSQGQPASGLAEQQNHNGRGGQFSGDRNFRESNGESQSAFEAELVEQAVIQELGLGRAVNETA